MKIITFLSAMVLYGLNLSAQCPVTISAGGPTAVCSGTVLLTATNGSGYTWQWRKNGVNINGSTGQTYFAGSTGNYSVFVTAPGGCTSVSNTVAVTVTLAPVISANGFNGIACINGGATLTVTSGPGYTYQWKFNGNNISGATASSYNAVNAGNYSCVVTSGSCSATAGLSVQNQIATLNHTGPTVFCTGQTNMSVTLNMGANPQYQWRLNGVNIQGANSMSYQATSSGNYSCQVNDMPFCNSHSLTSSLSVQAGVPPQIYVAAAGGTWPLSLCSSLGDLELYDGSTSILWQGGNVDWYKDGQLFASGGNILPNVLGSGIYSATVNTSCGIAVTQMGIPVISLPGIPPVKINNYGIPTACYNILLTIEPGSISFVPYQWKLNGVDIPGAIGSMHYATQTGSYTCMVSNACTTMVTDPVSLTITGAPAIITPQGSTKICAGSSVVLDATAAGATSYTWYLNGNPIPGGTGSTFTASIAGSYYVKVNSACGFVNSSTVAVTIKTTPAPVITSSGPLTFCSGGSVLLSTGNSAGATYQWKLNNVNIPGAVSNSYLATSKGNYKVLKTNSVGCKGLSNVLSVAVNQLPDAIVTPQGPTTFCAGDSVLLTAFYKSSYSFQWKKDNINIPGAINKKIYATSAGNYKVKVTNTPGCTKMSNIIVISVPCRATDNVPQENVIDIFPNPGNGIIRVKQENVPGEETAVVISNSSGAMVLKDHISNERSVIDATSLPDGFYIVHFHKSNDRVERKKLIIAR